uniref:Uncharacterized protein n=1 Tax=Panagrolaimus sp. ES5 TaxID=591445 RepID=A0AC34FUK3_9BILA
MAAKGSSQQNVINKRKAPSTFSESDDSGKRGRPKNFKVPDTFYDPNEKRITALEDENRYLRLQMNTLQNRVNYVEQKIDDILAGRIVIQNQNVGAGQLQQPLHIQSTPSEAISQIPSTSALPLQLATLPHIQDAPSWKWISEATTRDLYIENREATIFVRQLFKNLFTSIQAFQLQLPLDLKTEFEKICKYILCPSTEAEEFKLKKIIKTEIHYQKEKLRTKITHPMTAAVAMSESAIPLKQVDNVWIPVHSNVKFERLPGTNIQAWPILINYGQRVDTMYARRKKPGKNRSHWQYFIITKDGVMIYCSTE